MIRELIHQSKVDTLIDNLRYRGKISIPMTQSFLNTLHLLSVRCR